MPFLTTKKNKTPLGIYIHVPFCRSKCQYCDFYSLTNKDDQLMEGFLRAICAHIKESGQLAPGYRVDTIYFGGGTPSFFGSDGMATILTAIRRYFDVDSAAEITFEANPDSVSDKLLTRLTLSTPTTSRRQASSPYSRADRECACRSRSVSP